MAAYSAERAASIGPIGDAELDRPLVPLQLGQFDVIAEIKDRSPAVRRECAIALRGCDAEEAPRLWAELARQLDPQDRWYVEAQLKNYRSRLRGTHPGDIAGMRMHPMARWLRADEDLAAVAAYVASMPKKAPTPTLSGGNAANGKTLYANCAACHQANGQGLAGQFPAIAGSAIATGDLGGHIGIIMNGKPGTAMAAFGAQLNDTDIAAVITYQRNAFGNDTGDVVQPKAIQGAR